MHDNVDTPDRLDALIAAFAAAEYVVDAGPEPIFVRPGRATPALDRLLDGRQWAIITAHNPDGRMQSGRHNAAAHRRLEQYLHRLAPAARLPACNRDPAGDWPDEPGWLLTPNDIAQADRAARRFGQRAIVTGGAGRRAALRVYDDDGVRRFDLARGAGE